MKSCEPFISSASDYYNYSVSQGGRDMFFYPLCMGHFYYEAGYQQKRNSFDSFLLMYIRRGTVQVQLENETMTAYGGQFVFLDCYRPHGYRTDSGWEAYWLHFDGPVARAYYKMVVSRLGNVFSLADPTAAQNTLVRIYLTFHNRETIREAQLSKQISDILTQMLLYVPDDSKSTATAMEEIISYVNEHFTEELSIETLAGQAMLSPYHFIRTFKKETGFTPHEYLIHTRLGNARYLLKTSRMSIKDICFTCGFSSESVFCTSFKKHIGMTPAAYRRTLKSTP